MAVAKEGTLITAIRPEYSGDGFARRATSFLGTRRMTLSD